MAKLAAGAADALIEDIYDTVTFPERWSGVLERLCATAGATSGFLFTTATHQDARSLWARHNIADPVLSDYAVHFRYRDPWVNAAAAQGLLARCAVRRGEELVREAELRRSVIFNELLRESGMGRLCAVSLADGGELAAMQPVLSLFRPADAPPFSDEAAHLLGECAPHLQRAMRLRVRLRAGARGDGTTGWSADVLDRLPMGVVLLDAAKRILLLNRAGQAILDARDGLRLQHARLQADHAAEARRLAHALDAALSSGLPEATDLRVSRPSGRLPYLLTVLPLPMQVSMQVSAPAAERAAGGKGRAAVYIVDPSAAGLGATGGLDARLGRLFGLTALEARLVADLLADLTPAQSGGRRGVAISTVRSQLRSIFIKTGTTRQSELMNLMNRCLMLSEER